MGVDHLFAFQIEKAIEYFYASVEESTKVLSKSPLYVVLYQMAFSHLALDCLGIKGFKDSGIKAYQKAITANSSPGALLEQIYEVNRLRYILKKINLTMLNSSKVDKNGMVTQNASHVS